MPRGWNPTPSCTSSVRENSASCGREGKSVSWFSVVWKNRLGELASVTPQVEAVGILPRLGMRTTGSSSLFRAATGNVGSGSPSRGHKSMAAA
jgi:hypothetical protein